MTSFSTSNATSPSNSDIQQIFLSTGTTITTPTKSEAAKSTSFQSPPASPVISSAKTALKLKKWKKIAIGSAATFIIGGAGLIVGGALTSNPLIMTAGIVCAAVGGIFLLIAAYAAYKNHKANADTNSPVVPTSPSTKTSPPPLVLPQPVQPSASSPTTSTSTSTTTTIVAITSTTTSATATVSETVVQNSSPTASAPVTLSPTPPDELSIEDRVRIGCAVFNGPPLELEPFIVSPDVFNTGTNSTISICTVPEGGATSTSSTAPVSVSHAPVIVSGSMPMNPSEFVYDPNYLVSSSYESPLLASQVLAGVGGTDFVYTASTFPIMRFNPQSEKEVKEADENSVNLSLVAQSVDSVAYPLVVYQKPFMDKVWNVFNGYLKISESQALKLIENELCALSPILYHASPQLLSKIMTGFMHLKKPQFAATNIAQSLGVNSDLVKTVVDTAFTVGWQVWSSIFGNGNVDQAEQPQEENPLTAGDVVAGLYQRYQGHQQAAPERMMLCLLQSHSSIAIARDNQVGEVLEQVYETEWKLLKEKQEAKKIVSRTIVSYFSQAISTPAVTEAQAQLLAKNFVNAVGSGITQTLTALQANEKEENERLSLTAEMLRSFFQGQNDQNHPIVKMMVEKVTDIIANAIQNTSAATGTQYMKFTVVTKTGPKLLQWGAEGCSKACLNLMQASNPELFRMINGIVDSEAINEAISNAKIAKDLLDKASLVGHLWIYAEHWKIVVESLFDAEGRLSFNALLASEKTNPRLALAFSAICSIFSRGQSPEKYAGYLKSGMAAYEIFNYVSSADPVAFSQRLTQTIQAEGFFDKEGQEQIQSCNDKFKAFWTAEQSPEMVKFVENFKNALSKAKNTRIILAPNLPRPVNDAMKAAAKAATSPSKQDKRVAIGVNVAVNHVPGMIKKAVDVKVAFDRVDYSDAVVNIFKFFSRGLGAAGDAVVMNKLHDDAMAVKDAGIAAGIDKLDLDALLATGTAQLYTFAKEFLKGMELPDEGEQKIRIEEVDPPAVPAAVAVVQLENGVDDVD